MGKEEEPEIVTPGEIIGKASEIVAGKGTYVSSDASGVSYVYASLTGRRTLSHPSGPHQKPVVEITGHKAHGAVPEPGSIVLARVKKVMAKMASADIMCVGEKSVKEKFTGIIRQQDVRATEIDKVDMHSSFRAGDIVRAAVLSLGDARAYYLSTAKNEFGVVSAESASVHVLCTLVEKSNRLWLDYDHRIPSKICDYMYRRGYDPDQLDRDAMPSDGSNRVKKGRKGWKVSECRREP